MTGGAAAAFAVPGVETSVVGDARFASSDRVAPNAWTARAGGVSLRLEHDACGSWITLSVARGPRPFVLRRAGWCDLRGHPAPGDDRVGLGPGDALVLPGPGIADRHDATGARFGDEALPTELLRVAGDGAEEVAFRCWSAAQRFEQATSGIDAVAVLRVPSDAAEEPLRRVADATGIPVEELELPGYPVGDAQPELWRRPPLPPRAAWLLLAPEAAQVASVRELLRRLLSSWRLDALLDPNDVTLLASELATNAVRHAETESIVTVRWLGDCLRFEVEDASPVLPARRGPGVGRRLGGYGLQLIEDVATRWGVERTRRGKRVWFELTTA